jgi:hypothetical protein
MFSLFKFAVLIAVAAGAGCGGDDVAFRPTRPGDAAVAPDAARPDGSVSDASVPAVVDAGGGLDAGLGGDAGAGDAGPGIDASLDASLPAVVDSAALANDASDVDVSDVDASDVSDSAV